MNNTLSIWPVDANGKLMIGATLDHLRKATPGAGCNPSDNFDGEGAKNLVVHTWAVFCAASGLVLALPGATDAQIDRTVRLLAMGSGALHVNGDAGFVAAVQRAAKKIKDTEFVFF